MSRALLKAIPGVKLVDMVHNRVNGICCRGGGGVWLDTSFKAKGYGRLSDRRVREAVATGADVLATQFGHDELKIPMSTLTLMILMVQFVAFFGALLFSPLARWIGAQRAVMLALASWTAVVAAIHVSVRTTAQFFVLAAVVALILGGMAVLARVDFARGAREAQVE